MIAIGPFAVIVNTLTVELLRYKIPVDHVPPITDVVWSIVMIMEVISVFTNVYSQ